ncbi:MAG: glycosyltransferase family A protein [Planctomycetota bacterium]
MPSLSVIVPYRGNDSNIEKTLLSLLENRPHDAEILVVHDGSYRDPYDLGDEVLFVEAAAGASSVDLWNEGIMAACAPIVHTLVDGIAVLPGWTDLACELFAQDSIAASAVGLKYRSSSTYGIATHALDTPARLRKRHVFSLSADAPVSAPQISCGFYRKSVLLDLEGFRGTNMAEAELEMAYAFDTLGLECVVDDTTEVLVEAVPTEIGSRQLAMIAVDYGILRNGTISGISEALSAALVNPQGAISWSLGIVSAKYGQHQARITLARERRKERLQPHNFGKRAA